MWVERFLIITASLSQDFLPSSWHDYAPSFVDASILAGTLGFFTFAFLVFLRFVPFIPIRELQSEARR
jgi:molybdopterin-containing oxidoreductase family membrane subunit